jgi:hypothetical protein
MLASSPNQSLILHLHGEGVDGAFDLEIADRDILEALSRFGTVQEGVNALFKVGSCAILATSTGFDIQQVRQEIDRQVETTTQALQALATHVSNVIGEEGPLAAALNKVRGDLDTALGELVARQGDPEVPTSLTARLQGVAKRIDDTVTATRAQIIQDLRLMTEHQAEYIGKAMREMRDLDPSSAIGGAFARLEQKMNEVQSTLAASQAAATERQRGTAKGGDYEAQVVAEVAAIAAAIGDRAEHTGNQPGAYISRQKPSLRGDVTCILSPQVLENPPRIAIEAMDRGQVTARQVETELEEAMANREAQAAIAVISSAQTSVMCGQHFHILAPNKLAVVLEKEQPCVIPLQTVYRLARHLVLTAATRTSQADFDQLKKLVGDLNSKLALLASVKTPLTNIATCQEQAAIALTRAERELRAGINLVLDTLETRGRDEAA